MDEVGPRHFSRADGAGEDIIRLVEGHRAQRFEQLAEGADGEGDEARFRPAVRFIRFLAGALRVVHGGIRDLLDGVIPAVREVQQMAAESVGRDDVAPGFVVIQMDVLDHIRVLNVPAFRFLARLQTGRLQQRPQTAVEVKHLFPDQVTNVHVVFSLCACDFIQRSFILYINSAVCRAML